MLRLLFLLSAALLPASLVAQEAVGTAPATAAEKAAKTMAAFDALDAPGSKVSKDSKDSKPPGDESEADTGAVPSLLPAAAPDSARGMDLLSRGRLDMMVPVGRSHRGVHYPMYRPVDSARVEVVAEPGVTGGMIVPMESLFESDVVTRLDNDHVQFDRAKWLQFDEKPAADGRVQPSMKLEIERGIYDLKNEVLMTNQPVKIENRQFLLEGDTMLHDRASGLTRLTGRVRMTFFEQEPETDAQPAVPAPGDGPVPPVPGAAPQTPRKP